MSTASPPPQPGVPPAGPATSPSGEAPRLAWHHCPAQAVADYWQSDLDKGLSTEAAKERLARVGENRLPEEPPDPIWKKLLAQVSDFTVLALVGAALIA